MRPPLVCPRCRGHRPKGWFSAELVAHPAGLSCPACASIYPTVDGVPVILRDVDTWLGTEAPVVLARQDLPPAVRERVMQGAQGAIVRDDGLLRVYRNAPESALRTGVRAVVSTLDGAILDMGCGAGLHERSDVIGLDLDFALARAFPGTSVVADAADPPFGAGRFDAVLVLNLLDSCRQPRVVLGQADALLKLGGTLVISCAYAFQDDITPRDERFTSAQLIEALQGRALGLELGYELVRVEDPVRWSVRVSSRTVHHHDCQLVVARKIQG